LNSGLKIKANNLNCHSDMLLSRINSFGTNLNRLCLARRVNHTDVVH